MIQEISKKIAGKIDLGSSFYKEGDIRGVSCYLNAIKLMKKNQLYDNIDTVKDGISTFYEFYDTLETKKDFLPPPQINRTDLVYKLFRISTRN